MGSLTLSLLRQHLIESDSLRSQIMIIAGSTVVGQLIVILSAPLVSRLFTPADFGVSAAYSFLLMTLLAINSLRYEYAIPLPKEDSEARNLAGITFALVCVTSVVFTSLVWILAEPIAALLNEPRIVDLLPLLPFGLVFGGFLLGINYWLTRQRQFTTLSQVQIASSLGQSAAQISTGIAGLGAFGLAISFLFGQIVSVIVSARRVLPLQDINPRTWGTLVFRYRNFPLFSMAGSLVDIAGTQLPPVLFLAYFSAAEAGFFSLTTRIMSLPLGIISNAVAQTLYPRLSQLRDDRTALQQQFEKVATALLLLSLVGFGFLLVTGDRLFSLVFGSQWQTSGLYAQLLTPYFLIAFVTSPLSTLALVLDRQRTGLGFSLLVTVLRVVALLIGSAIQSAAIAVGLFSITTFAVYLIYLVWLMNLISLNTSNWLWKNRTAFGIAVLLIILGYSTRSVLPPLVHLGISLLAFGALGLNVGLRTFRILR